jgi:hypothetical protein
MKTFLRRAIVGICLTATGLFSSAFTYAPAHNEVVGEIEIDYAEGTITVIAMLEKRALTYGLKKEADCKPDEMMSLCAGEYFLQNLQLSLNGNPVELNKVDQRMEQHSMVITYQATVSGNTGKVDLLSTYLFRLNNHVLMNVRLSSDGNTKHYQLHAWNPSLTANF